MAGRLSYSKTYPVAYSKQDGATLTGTLVGNIEQSVFLLKSANGGTLAKGQFLSTIRNQGFTVTLTKQAATLPETANIA